MWEYREAIYVAFLMLCLFITYNKITKEKFKKDQKRLKEELRKLENEKTEFEQILQENQTIAEDNAVMRQTFAENQAIYNELIDQYNDLVQKYNALNAKNKIAIDNSQKLIRHIEDLEQKKQLLEAECQNIKPDFEARMNEAKNNFETEINDRKNQLETAYLAMKSDFEARMNEKIQEYTTEGAKRRKEMQDAWEKQIRTGNCPENITLRESNRSAFFVTVSATSIPGNYASMKFGSAVDALSFAESLREYFECLITVAQVSERGEYQVFLDGTSPEKIKPYYNLRTGKYEFMNPVYDGTAENYRAITDEQGSILRTADGGKYTTGEDYEKYVAERLAAAGYINIQLTSKSNDYGADLICEKAGIRYSVQCKMYTNPVGVAAVQEVNSSLPHYNCDKGIVITTNIFTSQARKLAGENGITLIENFT